MTIADASLTALRVFREVTERGTLTSAAAALGYTQSAVSRQVASLERAAGTPLLERRHDGVRPTTAGHVVLRHAATVLDQIDTAARELAGLPAEAGTVRLGWFTSAGPPRPAARGGPGPPGRFPRRGRQPAAPPPRGPAPPPPRHHRHHPGRQHPRAGPRAAGRQRGHGPAGLSAAVPPTRRGDTPA